MARTAAVNFTGPLQFPYANAATDLVKKEDIQTLAVAVDQHDHSSGKGLALAVGAIPNGAITSAMIADGTIATADLAPNAVTSAKMVAHAVSQLYYVVGTTSNPTITSGAGWAAIPDLTLTVTLGGSDAVTTDCLVLLAASLTNTNGSAILGIGIQADGAGPAGEQDGSLNGNAGSIDSVATAYYFPNVAPGSHTFRGYWFTSAGTMTGSGTQRSLTVLELRR